MKIATKRDDVLSEIDGVWVEYEDAKILIARLGNPKNRKAYEKARRKFTTKIKRDKMKIEDEHEVTSRTLSESIILDWKNVNDYQDNPLEPTVANFYKALKHDMDFRDFVSQQADISENFRAAEVEGDGGKSASGSGGKSKTATKKN